MKAIVSSLLPRDALLALEKMCDVFLLPPDSSIAYPVSTHPDMIVSLIGNTAVIPADYGTKNSALCDFLKDTGYDVVLSSAERSEIYPNDVGMNCAVGNGFIICREVSADPTVLCIAEKLGYSVIDVKQGYAGCSCIVCENAVITSDTGIYNSVIASGRESLLVPNSGIVLPGYNTGFIGGCGGFSGGVLYFTGDIDSVPAGELIRGFAKQRGYDIVLLSRGELTDFGGIKFV